MGWSPGLGSPPGGWLGGGRRGTAGGHRDPGLERPHVSAVPTLPGLTSFLEAPMPPSPRGSSLRTRTELGPCPPGSPSPAVLGEKSAREGQTADGDVPEPGFSARASRSSFPSRGRGRRRAPHTEVSRVWWPFFPTSPPPYTHLPGDAHAFLWLLPGQSGLAGAPLPPPPPATGEDSFPKWGWGPTLWSGAPRPLGDLGTHSKHEWQRGGQGTGPAKRLFFSPL